MTSYTFRLENDLKEQAFSVFQSYGLNPAQAIKMILRQVAETKTIPVQLDYLPNEKTAKAIRELNEGRGTTYTLKDGESLHDAMMRIAMDTDDEEVHLQ